MAKTKALISFAITAKLICVFVFAYAKSRFSHDAAHIIHVFKFEGADVDRVSKSYLSCIMRKTVLRISDQVRHKLGCTAIEDGQRLEISDSRRRGIVLSMQRKQRR